MKLDTARSIPLMTADDSSNGAAAASAGSLPVGDMSNFGDASPIAHADDPTVASAEIIDAEPGSAFVARTRMYAFVLDDHDQPVELGAGRFAKAYLGEERWVESKTALRRRIAIKVLQRGVAPQDQMRFQMEKEILERVQGHPNIVELFASGESDIESFIPAALRGRVENDFMLLELLDMSLEELLKGSGTRREREDLLAIPFRDRLFRALDFILPVATAIEYAHLICNTCHRDIKPANILVELPDPALRGSRMRVKLADFNVGKAADESMDLSMTRVASVPGTMYFQSPEQETNSIELLVNTRQGSPEVEFFEDFYSDICENDTFGLFNRAESYKIMHADREKNLLILARPWAEPTERNVRARVTKAVGRPADVYSLGALFYYLVTGGFGNPKSLHDSLRKFAEYRVKDDSNTVVSFIEHQYATIRRLRAPRPEGTAQAKDAIEIAPQDRFFSYKHYLDGNGELIDQPVMQVIAKAMVRDKPDSYCYSWDLDTTGVSQFVQDLQALYLHYGVAPAARHAYASASPTQPARRSGRGARSSRGLFGFRRKR